jgi:hypothetical protein
MGRARPFGAHARLWVNVPRTSAAGDAGLRVGTVFRRTIAPQGKHAVLQQTGAMRGRAASGGETKKEGLSSQAL